MVLRDLLQIVLMFPLLLLSLCPLLRLLRLGLRFHRILKVVMILILTLLTNLQSLPGPSPVLCCDPVLAVRVPVEAWVCTTWDFIFLKYDFRVGGGIVAGLVIVAVEGVGISGVVIVT